MSVPILFVTIVCVLGIHSALMEKIGLNGLPNPNPNTRV